MNSVSTVMKSALAKPSQNAVRAALSVIKFIGFAIHPNGARQKPFDPKPAEAPSRTLPRLRGRGDNAKPWRVGPALSAAVDFSVNTGDKAARICRFPGIIHASLPNPYLRPVAPRGSGKASAPLRLGPSQARSRPVAVYRPARPLRR